MVYDGHWRDFCAMTLRLADSWTSDRILRAQDGTATLRQLTSAGMSENYLRAQVAARRWQRFGDHCVLTHNFSPSRSQHLWLAVLEPVVPVALAGVTALETNGFKFFGRELDLVHIVVPRGARPISLPSTKIHESRRFDLADLDRRSVIPRTRIPRSALDAAAWQPSIRYACALLAAVVQQGLCTASDLAEELRFVGRVRHKASMRLAISDIAGGAEALSEIDIASLCRKFGLRPPRRQRVRTDRNGRRRYLDCEWTLQDGSIVVLEVDGGHHILVQHWSRDMKRERGVVISGRRVLRATAFEARHEQAGLAADLVAIGIPRIP